MIFSNAKGLLTILIMKVKNIPAPPVAFTPKENTLLKSIALGLGCEDIRKLLDLNDEAYAVLCEDLFMKLGVSNHYTAVNTAFKKNYIDRKEFCSEDIKSVALQFVHDRLEKLKQSDQYSKHLLWNLYDILLEFHLKLENYSTKKKKSNYMM